MPEQNIFIFLGSNEMDKRKRVSKFLAMFTDPTVASMNTSHLDAQQVSLGEMGNISGAMPFLSSQRLVILENVGKRYKLREIVKEPDAETGKEKEVDRSSLKPAEERKKFLAFLEKVPDFTQLLILEDEEIKERDFHQHWLVKWATANPKKGLAKNFELPLKDDMPRWIVIETKQQGGLIDFPAARHLADMIGEDTWQASTEITKLLTYVNYAHSISVEDVEAVSIVTASVSIFELVDALGAQNGRLAQKLFHRMLEEKDAFELFGMVIRQFRLLLLARDVLDDGGTSSEAPEWMGVVPFVASKALVQAKFFSMDTLKAIYHRLLAMDEAAKTGGMPLDTSLDMFIVELSGK